MALEKRSVLDDDLLALAIRGETQQSTVMAGLLGGTLYEAVPVLYSLMANAPTNAGTYIHQLIEKCEYGKQEIDRVFGYGEGYGGPGGQPTSKGTRGGKGH